MPNRFWSTPAMLLAQRSELASHDVRHGARNQADSRHGRLTVVEGGAASSPFRTVSAALASTSSLAVVPAPEPHPPLPVDWVPGSLQHLRAARLLVQKGL